MFAEQTETNLPSYRPTVFTTFKDSAIADRAMLVRNDGKQQTETNSSHKRSFASLKMTSVGHSEPREESHKLDCFTPSHKTILNRFVWQSVRNDVKEIFPRPLRERVRVRGNDSVIADRASLVRNDVTTLVPSKRIAFTLAEVLVTLGIIGVVSAMTLPTLVKNHQRKVFVTQLHKVYNEVQQAVDMYVTDNNYVSLGESRLKNNPTELKKFVKNYFKIAKDCDTKWASCAAEEYTSLKGNVVSHKGATCNVVVALADGATLCFDVAAMGKETDDEGNISGSSFGVEENATEFMTVEFDINGKQGPNMYGRDAFHFDVNAQGQIFDKFYVSNGNAADLDNKWIVNGTFGKIMNDGWEMNY